MSEASQTFSDGKAYELLMGRWSRRVGGVFIDWLKPPFHQAWLDVGCGNGAFTEEIIARCYPSAVTGIDPSGPQITYARSREGTKMATFEVGGAEALPFADAGFDAAIMALVISFLPNPAKAVAEMARVVRPGGWIAAYMWDIPGGGVPLQPIYEALLAMGLEAPHPPNPPVSTLPVMQQLWEAAGLAHVSTRVIPINVEHADFNAFWAANIVPVGPLGGILRDMPEQQKDQLRYHLHRILPVQPDGRIVYEAVSNAVKGQVPP